MQNKKFQEGTKSANKYKNDIKISTNGTKKEKNFKKAQHFSRCQNIPKKC